MVQSGVTVMYGIIGMQVATARKNRSQSEIATAAGVTQGNVSNLERGIPNMSRDTAKSVFDAVGLRHSAELADLFQALKTFTKAYGKS
jgi:transcriptional regulator with XRE-family HTH domain